MKGEQVLNGVNVFFQNKLYTTRKGMPKFSHKFRLHTSSGWTNEWKYYHLRSSSEKLEKTIFVKLEGKKCFFNAEEKFHFISHLKWYINQTGKCGKNIASEPNTNPKWGFSISRFPSFNLAPHTLTPPKILLISLYVCARVLTMQRLSFQRDLLVLQWSVICQLEGRKERGMGRGNGCEPLLNE